jgi:hypothetical protein
MSDDVVRRIADAVLYEGYILWPYRRSAIKNRQRWTFGGVYPRAHSEGRDDDPWTMRAECLVRAENGSKLEVRARFLQVVDRRLRAPDGRFVDELRVGGERHLAWEEARERELVAPALGREGLERGHTVELAVPAGQEREALRDPEGRPAGEIVRSWHEMRGTMRIAGVPVAPGVLRLSVVVANESPWEGGERAGALKRTFCSTHLVLRVTGGEFVSLTDPPEALRGAAEECANEGVWPVLVGEPEATDTMLASPIILEDHPRIAPESPGDLFDGAEIDQLLTLNILSLTDEEKAEMRDSDPRAREILERTESFSEEETLRLHGAIREFGMRRA